MNAIHLWNIFIYIFKYCMILYFIVTHMLTEDTLPFLSTRLDDVVDSYEHAIFAQYPRDRYQVGLDSRFFFIPISNLSACIQDFLMKVLSKTPLIPAACKKKKWAVKIELVHFFYKINLQQQWIFIFLSDQI